LPKKIRLTIELTLSDRKMQKEKITANQVLNDLEVKHDPFVDGFIITREGKLGDVATDFYLEDAEVISQDLIEGEN